MATKQTVTGKPFSANEAFIYLKVPFQYEDSTGQTQKSSEAIPIGAATGLSLRINRVKAPIYPLGYKTPAQIGRSFRSIEGALSHVILDVPLLLKIYAAIRVKKFGVTTEGVQTTLPQPILRPLQTYVNETSRHTDILKGVNKYLEALGEQKINDNFTYSPAWSDLNGTVSKYTTTEINYDVAVAILPVMLDELIGVELYIAGISETEGDKQVLIIKGIEFEDSQWRVAANQVAVTDNLTFSATFVRIV